MKKLCFLKPGKFTDAKGLVLEFSEADLKAMVDAYDPKLFRAPLCIAHPKSNDPAYGWVKSISFDAAEKTAKAVPEDVEASFADWVNSGRYPNISPSVYLPDSPNNPKPGTFYLRHLGFLGAHPPAIKGLPPAKIAAFSEEEPGTAVLTLDFSEFGDIQNAALWRQLRNFFLSMFGMEKADQAIPEYAVKTLETEAEKPTETPQPNTAGFSENSKEEPMPAPNNPTTPATGGKPQGEANFAEKEAQLSKLGNELREKEEKLRKQEMTLKKAEHASFAEGLFKSGKIIGADKEPLTAFLAGIGEADTVEFSENGSQVKKPSLDFIKRLLGNLPAVVPLGEIGKNGVGDFSESENDAKAVAMILKKPEEVKK